MPEPLLEVRGLCTDLSNGVRALDGVDFSIEPERTLGLVGESGSGKTLTALAILQLLPEGARIVEGEVRLAGQRLTGLSEPELRALRGRRMSMVFQEPMTSLNPVFTVGDQIAEVVQLHLGKSRSESLEHAVAMLRQVGIAAPEMRAAELPHRLSGGMRQRVMIAMALACGPELLIADEPTASLDSTVQAQILTLLRDVQRARKMAVLLIGHDLAVMAQFADEIAVMYAGRIIEHASSSELLGAPKHPYTRALLRSASTPARASDGRRVPLATIPGTVPRLGRWPSGCRFRDRCERATELCASQAPPLVRSGTHQVACHHAEASA